MNIERLILLATTLADIGIASECRLAEYIPVIVIETTNFCLNVPLGY